MKQEIFHWRNKVNELLSKKYKNVYKALNYIQHLLILAFTVTGCNFKSAFASWVAILVGITISAGRIKICAITAVFKKHLTIKKNQQLKKSTIKKNKSNHDKIVLLVNWIP